MKALSLTQPWAEMILHHGKRIENRERWKGCSYRGPILLHAAKGVGSREEFGDTIDAILDIVKPAAGAERLAFLKPLAEMRVGGRGVHHASGWWAPSPDLRRGGIVGRARIVDVIRPIGSADATFGEWILRGDGSPTDVAWRRDQRKWWFGGFALVLDDVKPIPYVPWPGALGLFDVPNLFSGGAM